MEYEKEKNVNFITREKVTIYFIDGNIVEQASDGNYEVKLMSNEECINDYGRTINRFNGYNCEDNEGNIGEIKNSNPTSICCKLNN